MKTKKNLLFIKVSIILILSIVIVCLIGFITTESLHNRFFVDIGDFNKLDQYTTKELDISNDKELNGLVPESSYIKEILYNGHTYTVYAYVFADTDSAISYFKQYTGKTTDSEYNFSMSTNVLFHSEYVAYYGCSLYRVEGSGYKSFAKTVNFINESFPIDLNSLIKDS